MDFRWRHLLSRVSEQSYCTCERCNYAKHGSEEGENVDYKRFSGTRRIGMHYSHSIVAGGLLLTS